MLKMRIKELEKELEKVYGTYEYVKIIGRL